MLPSVVVLGVEVQNGLSELKLMRRIVQPLDDDSAVMPHLIILRVVLNDVMNVVQLVVQVFVQSLEDLATVLPNRVVRCIETKSIAGELQGSFGLFLRRQNRSEVVVDVKNCGKTSVIEAFVQPQNMITHTFQNKQSPQPDSVRRFVSTASHRSTPADACTSRSSR